MKTWIYNGKEKQDKTAPESLAFRNSLVKSLYFEDRHFKKLCFLSQKDQTSYKAKIITLTFKESHTGVTKSVKQTVSGRFHIKYYLNK